MNNAVVIVTYNRKALLEECLSHVLAQTVPFDRIVVVDNASTDGTQALLSDYAADPRFTIRRMPENLGGAGGFCAALSEIQRQTETLDYVLIIDDDAMIEADYMEKICTFAQEHPETAAFAGRVETDGRVDTTHRRRLGGFLGRLMFLETSVPKPEYEAESFPCDLATFCGLVIRGSAISRIGLPKAEYFLWYDDTEYCLRLRPCGGITVLPKARLDHRTALPEVSKGLLDRITWRQYYGYRNRHDTARRHLPAASALCVRMQYRLFLLLSGLMCLSPLRKKRAQGRYNCRLLRAVLSDAKSGRLGKNAAYQPES